MLAFSVHEDNVKVFMQHLFALPTFSSFRVQGVSVSSFAHFDISDCDFNWEEMQPYIRFILKGRDKPRGMKFVFAHENPQELHDNAAALFINIVYDSEKINITTATSQKQFALDKSLDKNWDEWVYKFIQEKKLPAQIAE